MKFHIQVCYSKKELLDFINNNGIKREDIQDIKVEPRFYEVWYWGEK